MEVSSSYKWVSLQVGVPTDRVAGREMNRERKDAWFSTSWPVWFKLVEFDPKLFVVCTLKHSGTLGKGLRVTITGMNNYHG